MRTIDFDYHLPEELIADRPLADRAASRMLVVHRDTGLIEHRHFHDIMEYVQPGDHFVLNNTKVVPARYFSNDGSIELVRAGLAQELVWKCLVRPGKKMKVGRTVQVGDATGTVESIDDEGYRYIRWDKFVDPEVYGRLALPHYMNRESEPADKERYQTIYAEHEGAIAAPTAGLHFTKELLEKVRQKGVKTAFVTLHVGLGTFRPVKVAEISDHHMHSELCMISEEKAQILNQTKAEGGRVICVGTTSCRTLESLVNDDGTFEAKSKWTDIFIYPGYTFKAMDGLITNFHLPESTLVMLVSAFAGRENVLHAYEVAVQEKYRFFSFGDAMFIA